MFAVPPTLEELYRLSAELPTIGDQELRDETINRIAALVTEGFGAPVDPEKRLIFERLQAYLATREQADLFVPGHSQDFLSSEAIAQIGAELRRVRHSGYMERGTSFLNEAMYFRSRTARMYLRGDQAFAAEMQRRLGFEAEITAFDYVVYERPGAFLRFHIDKPRYAFILIGGLVHTCAEEEKSSRLVVLCRQGSVSLPLCPGEAVLFNGCALLHARTPLLSDEVVAIYTIGLRQRLP